VTALVNKDSHLVASPLYKRAEAAMVERLVNRTWQPGQRIPNEFELADEFNVSQGTIRKALNAMERRGLLSRSPGKGTVVAKTTPVDALYAFFRMRDSGDGRMVVPEPLSEAIERRDATDEELQHLEPTSTKVFELRRVRQSGGRPLVVEKMSFSTILCPSMDKDLPLPNSLYPYLQDHYGIAVMSARESIASIKATSDIAMALGIEVGAPVLRVKRWARDLAGRVIELRSSHYSTDFSNYEVELERVNSVSDLLKG